MAAPTNTVTALTAVGNREDLEDTIYRVAPEETPFISNIGTVKPTAVFHEWQTENLATPDPTNAAVEGNAFTIQAGNTSARVGNYCQIVTKAYGVSRTEEIVKKAGRSSELNRQKVLKGIEGRRDLEARAIGNYASNVESGATPRHLGGALAWLTTNTSVGASGANGGFGSGVVAAATNGTLRTFTEVQVKAVMASIFGSRGGKNTPIQAYMGPTQKQEFSAFTGIAELRRDAPGNKPATIVGASDMYISDFGSIAMVAHPYGLTRDVLFADADMWALGVLDGWKSTPLAKQSDSEQYALTWEGTLVCRNERASGVVRDVQ